MRCINHPLELFLKNLSQTQGREINVLTSLTEDNKDGVVKMSIISSLAYR